MRRRVALAASALVLCVVLPVGGCRKPVASQTDSPKGANTPQTQESAKQEGPRGNPVLPGHGQQLTSGGAIQNVRQAARRTADISELYNFSLAYYQYRILNNRPPMSMDDIKDSLEAKTLEAFKEGFYVAVWNVRDSSSEALVAYVKDPDSFGTRIVATADGKARRMEKQDFETSLKRRP
jgi:hypothetical protein